MRTPKADGLLTSDYIWVYDLAEDLGTTPRYMLRECKKPDGLPYVYVGPRMMIKKDDVRAWLDRRTVRNQVR
jgi:hypothetical protein